MAKCPNCGFDGLPEGSLVCTNCGANITQPIQEIPSAPPPPTEVVMEEIPWKKRTQIGFVDAFIKNVTEILTNPVQFFQKIKTDGDWVSMILWVVIIAWIIGFFGFIWSSIFHISFMPFMSKFSRFGYGMPMGFGVFSSFIFTFVLAPVWSLIGFFIGTALIHIAALIFGDGEKGFEMTANACCYAYTPYLLGIIPYCGSIIGGIWSFVLLVIGLKYGHKTETWKAIMAPLIWVILFTLCFAIAGALFFAFLSKGFGGASY